MKDWVSGCPSAVTKFASIKTIKIRNTGILSRTALWVFHDRFLFTELPVIFTQSGYYSPTMFDGRGICFFDDWYPRCIGAPTLTTYCNLMMSYCDIALSHHWLSYWFVAWQHQAITWTDVDLSSERSFGTPPRAILHDILGKLVFDMS